MDTDDDGASCQANSACAAYQSCASAQGGDGGDSCQSEQEACQTDADCGPISNAARDNQLYSAYRECQHTQGGNDDGGGGLSLGELQHHCPDETNACQADSQCLDELSALLSGEDANGDMEELHAVKDCMRGTTEISCPFSIMQAQTQCESEVYACDIAPQCMDSLIAVTGSAEMRAIQRCMHSVEGEVCADDDGGGGTPEDDDEDGDGTFVQVQVTLSATMEQVEADRAGFEVSFKTSVAAELSVVQSAIEITNVAAGSVVVSFTVSAPVAAGAVSTALDGAALAGFAVTAVEAELTQVAGTGGASIDCTCQLTADGTGCATSGALDTWPNAEIQLYRSPGNVCHWFPGPGPGPTGSVDKSTGCKPDISHWQCHSSGWMGCIDGSCGGDVEPSWSQPVEAEASVPESCTPECTGGSCEAPSCALKPGMDCSTFAGVPDDDNGSPDQRACSLEQIYVSEASTNGNAFIELHNSGAECSLSEFTLTTAQHSPRRATDSTGSTSTVEYVSTLTENRKTIISAGYQSIGLDTPHDSVFMFAKDARIGTRSFWLGYQNDPNQVGDHDDSFSFPLSGAGSVVYLCAPCIRNCERIIDKAAERRQHPTGARYSSIDGALLREEFATDLNWDHPATWDAAPTGEPICKAVALGSAVEGISYCFDAAGARCECTPTPGAPNSGSQPTSCAGITTTVDGEYSWSVQLTLNADHSTLGQDFATAFRLDAKAAIEAEGALCGVSSLGVDVEIPQHIQAIRPGATGETIVDFAVHSCIACTGPGYHTQPWIMGPRGNSETWTKHDIAVIDGTLAGCQSACSSDQACVGFSRNGPDITGDDETGNCFLKKSLVAADREYPRRVYPGRIGEHESTCCGERNDMITYVRGGPPEANPICMGMVVSAFAAAGVSIAGTTTNAPLTQVVVRPRTSSATGCSYQPATPARYRVGEVATGQTTVGARESHVFRHVKVSDQNAGTGGALAVDVGSHVSISNAVYEGNSANFGGALYFGPERVTTEYECTLAEDKESVYGLTPEQLEQGETLPPGFCSDGIYLDKGRDVSTSGDLTEEAFITGKQTGTQTPRSTVSITSTRFLNNRVDAAPGTPVGASDSYGNRNTAFVGLGGAIYVLHSKLTLQHTTFWGNRNTAFADSDPHGPSMDPYKTGLLSGAHIRQVVRYTTITGVAPNENERWYSDHSDGGAIYAVDSALLISASSLFGNVVGTTGGTDKAPLLSAWQLPQLGQRRANGGAIHLSRRSSLSMQYTTLSGNIADGLGGAIYVFGSSASIRTSSFVRNDALRGGAIYMADATVTIDSSMFTGNQADVGGAIYAESGFKSAAVSDEPVHYGNSVLNVSRSEFKANLAGGHLLDGTPDPEITPGVGAAISVQGELAKSTSGYDAVTRSHVSVHISASNFVDNSAPLANDALYGGAIRVKASPLTVVSSAFVGNTHSTTWTRYSRNQRIRATSRNIWNQQAGDLTEPSRRGSAVYIDHVDDWKSKCDQTIESSAAVGSCDPPFKIYNTTFEPFVPESHKTVHLVSILLSTHHTHASFSPPNETNCDRAININECTISCLSVTLCRASLQTAQSFRVSWATGAATRTIACCAPRATVRTWAVMVWCANPV